MAGFWPGANQAERRGWGRLPPGRVAPHSGRSSDFSDLPEAAAPEIKGKIVGVLMLFSARLQNEALFCRFGPDPAEAMTNLNNHQSDIRAIGLVRRYLSILDAANAEDIPVSLEALYENRKAIDETWQYLEGGTDATFGVVWNSTQELDDQDGIYITAAQLGDGRVFGLAVPMSFSFERDGDEGQGRGRIGKQTATIELLREPVLESYDHFVRRVEKLARFELRIVVGLGANPDVSQTVP